MTRTDKNNKQAKAETPAANGFERFFYRYIAWFPLLVMPMLVVELMGDGQHGFGAVVALIHAVLVFRFVQVVNIPALFRKKAPGA
ncbi:hypothetical protein ACQUQU_16480 [Thalassolituus sp. LLYu03]|uniref:hypothetical protein n=1 Tax=Thalassolituus sp. LLYu03 TaxID=3421656 RepID=UPI003D2ADF5C